MTYEMNPRAGTMRPVYAYPYSATVRRIPNWQGLPPTAHVWDSQTYEYATLEQAVAKAAELRETHKADATALVTVERNGEAI